MGISLEKWLVMGALGIISFILGMIPYFIIKKIRGMRRDILHHVMYHLILTILSCFGAGVLLSTTAMHIIPEVRESLEGLKDDWTNDNIDDHFPLAEVFMLAGFCLIYLIEEIAHFIMMDSGHGHGHSHSHHNIISRHSSMAHAIPVNIPGGPRPSLLSTTGSGNFIVIPSGVSITLTPDLSEEKNNNTKESSNRNLNQYNDDDDEKEQGFGSRVRSLLALIALSFHAIMEGITIGIQDTSNIWFLFGAIASHKFVISFCMGMELCASRAKITTILSSVILFAVLSPVGIFIGSYLTSDEATNSFGVVMIEGFASGTLLYVVFFEILSRERERKSGVLKLYRFSGFVQFLSLAVGLIAMGYLLSVNEHSHGNEQDDDHDHSHDDDGGEEHKHIKMLRMTLNSL